MTPQEKADEICRKMLYQIEWNAQPSTVKGVAKQCALICVEEMIMYMHDIDVVCHIFNNIDYWKKVKEEIEKL